ncbi:fibronectin type III domain-containing protein [Cohnella sp.]|uniref:fibronectin type III domain-containing protein n=1 Tax=Cohnella sp. TaxID=1883426 RepID=UPI0035676AC9
MVNNLAIVRSYDGSGWNTEAGGKLNLSAEPGNEPTMMELNGELYAAWLEKYNVFVKKYNESNGQWQLVSPSAGLNSYTSDPPRLVVYNNKLYAVWREWEQGVAGSNKIMVSRYNGGTSWTSVVNEGLSTGVIATRLDPSAAVYKDKFYVAWSEGNQVIRAKSYDGEDWEWVDNNKGLNFLMSAAAKVPKLIAYDGYLYASWTEAGKIRVKKYNGISWTAADSGLGLNAGNGTANDPSLGIHDGKLYASWAETSSGQNQIRVAQMPLPPTAPGAPTNVSATAGVGEATVSFDPPASNGGSPITEYIVTSSPGGLTGTGGSSPITVTGLTYGENYTFSVSAKNSAGTSVSSVASNEITPLGLAPDAPANVTATAGNGSASISFDPPANDGGSPITGYVVTSNPGGFTATGSASPITVTGLTNGENYEFTVVATNAVGDSVASSPSNAVVPAPVAPGIPTNVTAAAGVGEATVSFDPPTSDGGSPITEYVVTSIPDGLTGTGAASPITVTGVTYGVNYTFTVTAKNVAGVSAASAPSNPINPLAFAPDAPLNVTATAGNGSALISFDPPGGDGGSPITNYVVTSSPGGYTASGGSSPITVTGLTNGESYTFKVAASNAAGASVASAPSNAIVPTPLAPDAPTQVVAVPGIRGAIVSFDPPDNDGGSSITEYAVTASPGGLTATGSASPIQVTGLTYGVNYTFTVTAKNGAGISVASAPSSEMTPLAFAPDAPTNVTASAGNGSAVIRFDPPGNDGGSPITEFVVTSNPGGITATGGGSPITVTGLNNGESYTFTVIAQNLAGSGAASAESNSVTPAAPSGGSGGTPPAQSGPTGPSAPANTGVDVLVNGKAENAGTATRSERAGQSVTTISVDENKLAAKLAAEGSGAVVAIPVGAGPDVVIGELNGRMVRSMEDKRAVLEIRTARATYSLPALQINIDALSEQIGKSVALEDIKVRIEIAAVSAEAAKVVENAAEKGSFTLVSPSLEFKVQAVFGDRTIKVEKFNAYVERTVAIPDGVDPNKITTGVVVDPNGTVRHVPTKVVVDGKYYAKINSLTNSAYSVVWHPLEFADVAKHWAKDAVNDMGSRMVIGGVGNGLFSPDRDITRAEFAAIVVRALGLKPETGAAPFSDVKESDWYNGAVKTAHAYGLIDGMGDGTFRPNDKITREQAMTIIAEAMKLTGLNNGRNAVGTREEALEPFADRASAAGWARSGIADSVRSGIVTGRNSATLAPKAYMTRAETASIVQRLLQKSGLI